MNHPEYLQAISDNLATRQSGAWAEDKLDYLQRYIGIFETSMKSRWPHRNYIDLFAGPGKNEIRETGRILLGSPLISITTKFPFTGYFFADFDSTNVNALQDRCSESNLNNIVHIYHDDANQIVVTVVRHICQFSPNSLNLAFLDPEGLELEWSTIKQLATLRCDLIIHYSQHGLSRFIPRAYETNGETIIDRFFGNDQWRNIYSSWFKKPKETGMHRDLMDLYKQGLESLGYKSVKQSDEIMSEPLIRHTKSNAPLYRLLFASKHSIGEEFWQKITKRDSHGQKQMF